MNDQKDWKDLYTGISYAAWGYFFLYIDFKVSTISIFPAFAGYLFFLSAINLLSARRREIALLREFAILLALWHGAGWLLSWWGGSFNGKIFPLDLIVKVVELYFHFQFFTDFAALARECGGGETLGRRILRLRTVQVLLTTGGVLAVRLPIASAEYLEVLVFFWAIVAVVVALCLMSALFSLRKCVRESALTGSLPM